MTDIGERGHTHPPEKSGANFRLSFNLGSGPDEAELKRALEEASAMGGSLSTGVSQTQVEFQDGVLRFVRDGQPQYTYDFGTDRSQSHLPDPFPIINTLRRWVNILVTSIAIAVPVALLAVAVLTHQRVETGFYMTLFGLVVCVMMLSSLQIKRSPVEDLLPLLMEERARNQRRESPGEPPRDRF